MTNRERVMLSICLDGKEDLGAYSIGEARFIREEPMYGRSRYIWGIDVEGYKTESGVWLMEREGKETACSIFANIWNETVKTFEKKVTVCNVGITLAVDEIPTWHCVLEFEGENPYGLEV